MMSMFHGLHWLPWLAGGGILTAIVVVVLAPSVAAVVSAYLVALAPLLRGAAEGIVGYVKILGSGLMDVIDSVATIIFVLTLMVGAALWGVYHTGRTCKPTYSKTTNCERATAAAIKDLRKEYKFVPRKQQQ